MADLIPNFQGDIVTPSDPSYPSAIARWAANAVRRAKIVAFPKDQDDVALAITYARSHNLPLAIRGGGHHPGGASSVEDGLVIDLSRYFNKVRIDLENKRAYVGGGALWETLEKEAIKYELATVAGNVNNVCRMFMLLKVLIDERSMIDRSWRVRSFLSHIKKNAFMFIS